MEIGSYVGASAYFLSAALARTRSHGKLICVDTWENDAMTEGFRDTWSEFCSNMKYPMFIVPVRGHSTELIDKVRQHTTEIDLLFIDGDHGYQGVKADWEAYKSFLHQGSVVIFHDFGWAEGVQRVVREDVLPLVLNGEHLPNMWWGTIA